MSGKGKQTKKVVGFQPASQREDNIFQMDEELDSIEQVKVPAAPPAIAVKKPSSGETATGVFILPDIATSKPH
jgi:hypothetical protein